LDFHFLPAITTRSPPSPIRVDTTPTPTYNNYSVKLPLLLAFSLVLSLFAPPIHASPFHEPLQRRLLRTIQIGTPQDITLAEISRIAENPNSKYIDAILARSALLVLQHANPKLTSYDELFVSVLNNLIRDSNAFPNVPGLPDFYGKETALTMVYAMVMSGQQERVTDILEKNLLTGSEYKQAVILSALRNIGTPRAIGLIQKYGEAGKDSNLAQTAIVDEDYPVLFEMLDRWNLVPPPQRTRDNLRTIIQSGCNQRAAMATYWLGFFAPNLDPNAEVAELQALEAIVHKNTPDCEMIEHIIALKSLALRSRKSIDFWTRLAAQTPNVWERHQIIINAWGRFGRKFAPAALALLKTEPTQYIQWELLNGNLETRQGYIYRSYWDIWIPVNILVPVKFPDRRFKPPRRPGEPKMDEPDLNAMLKWLESGARPKDPWVSNHMLYNLVGLVSGDDTLRLLRLFNAHPERAKNYWIIDNLEDPAALPLLQYWATLPAPPDQLDNLKRLAARLENLSHNHAHPATAAATPCCEPTEACLRTQVIADLAAPSPATASSTEPAASAPANHSDEIHSEADARKWLARKPSSPSNSASDFTISYNDDLKRAATIHRKSQPDTHYEYLYDCWHKTTATPTPQPQ
jgi:hypothetical protein